MKSTIATLAVVAGSQAMVYQDVGCCFTITAYGGPGGPVGQLGDGQNRIGQQGLPAGGYCIGADGGLKDAHGRGCEYNRSSLAASPLTTCTGILTLPTTQWQCDVGAAPTPGFSVSVNGTISHDGESTFYACFTGDQGAWNIYSQKLSNEPTCTPIWILADSCHAEQTTTSTVTAPCTTSTASPLSLAITHALPPPPATTHASLPPPPPPPPSSPAPKPACPANLPYNFEAPHLIVPVSSLTPDTPAGTSYNGSASSVVSSIFNFDMPSSLSEKVCDLVFLLPEQSQLETSAYELSGAATFSFDYLREVATKDTTYSNAPPSDAHLGTVKLHPGTMTTISEREGCSAGKTVSFAMSAVGDSSINYFQDSNSCPLGLYIIPH